MRLAILAETDAFDEECLGAELGDLESQRSLLTSYAAEDEIRLRCLSALSWKTWGEEAWKGRGQSHSQITTSCSTLESHCGFGL